MKAVTTHVPSLLPFLLSLCQWSKALKKLPVAQLVTEYRAFIKPKFHYGDLLCGRVVRVPDYRNPGSILGDTRFSEK
jgi:hypothetical protein